MIIPAITSATAAPVAYAGGQASTAKPSFGAALQATLAQLQATNQGVTAAHHKHAGHHAGLFQHNAPFGGGTDATTPTMPPL